MGVVLSGGRRAGGARRRRAATRAAVLDYVRRSRAPRDFVTVVVPEQLTKRSILAAVRRPQSFRLKLRLLREPEVVVTDVPVLVERPGTPTGASRSPR